MDTLKGLVDRSFNFSAQSQNFTGGLTGLNLPIGSKVDVNQKDLYTSYLKDNLILFISH